MLLRDTRRVIGTRLRRTSAFQATWGNLVVKTRLRTNTCFLIVAGLLLLFAWGESTWGQKHFLGLPPMLSGNEAQDAFAGDGRMMGAGLAPVIFFIVPCLIEFFCGAVFFTIHWWVSHSTKDRRPMV